MGEWKRDEIVISPGIRDAVFLHANAEVGEFLLYEVGEFLLYVVSLDESLSRPRERSCFMTSWPVYRRTLRILGIVTALLITPAVALLPGGIGALTNPTGRLALAEAEGAQHTSTAYTFHNEPSSDVAEN